MQNVDKIGFRLDGGFRQRGRRVVTGLVRSWEATRGEIARDRGARGEREGGKWSAQTGEGAAKNKPCGVGTDERQTLIMFFRASSALNRQPR